MSERMFDRFRKGGQPQRLTDPATGALQPRDAGSGSGPRITEAEVLAAIERVPSLPAVVTQILSMVGKERVDAHDMEALIERDMVIAGRLLKLVNSHFYGLPNSISSIQQSVAIVGFNSLRSLVLAASAAGILQAQLSAYGYEGTGLWKNSVVVASLAKEVAMQAGLDRELADEYFIAGLLRDVGMLVLGPFLVRQGKSFRRGHPDKDLLVAERRAVGYDHCWVGERIARRWQLPDRLRFVITKHHRIPKDCSPEDMQLLASVRLAERLTCKANVGLCDDHFFPTQVDAVLLSACGLDADGLKRVVDCVPQVVDEAYTFEA